MLASTLTYTHSNGTLDDKEYFMNTLRTEQVIYHSLEHDDLQVRFINPDTAILNGVSDVTVTLDGSKNTIPLRFTVIYTRENGDWKFEAWHSSRRQQMEGVEEELLRQNVLHTISHTLTDE